MTTKRDRAAYYAAWAEQNRDKLRANSARYRKNHLEQVRTTNREYAQRTSEERKKTKRLKRYGITPEQYDAMLAAQGGHCAICPATEPGGRGEWHVDHDHETGEVRGLLCSRCNLGIGLFRDTPGLLESAATYLRRHFALLGRTSTSAIDAGRPRGPTM